MRERSPQAVSDRRLTQPGSVHRRLIRASLSDLQEQMNAPDGIQKRTSPPEQTSAECFYYLKQMRARTPMVVVLHGGEILHGVIEWYDKRCIKVNRVGKPNLLIRKSAIRYMYKQPVATSSNTAPAGR